MDHLKTTQERKNRWYARHITPRFIPIRDVDPITITRNSTKSQSNQDGCCSYIDGIPFKAISEQQQEEKDQKLMEVHMKSHLKRHGFVVITKALSIEECNHGLRLAWDYIEAASSAERYMTTMNNSTRNGDDTANDNQNRNNGHKYEHENTTDRNKDGEKKILLLEKSPIQRDDPFTYCNYIPRTVEGGILPFYGSGHTSFMWFLRSHSSIQRIFASIHGIDIDTNANDVDLQENMLSSSLDGIIAWIEKRPATDSGWFHIDQNPISKPGFESVQGLVNLLPTTEQTGGNVLVQKSHLLFPHHYIEDENDDYNDHNDKQERSSLFYKDRLREINGDDWLEIDPYDEELLDPTKVISCMLGPGDVLIWDSRLVHCSYPAARNTHLEEVMKDGNEEESLGGNYGNNDIIHSMHEKHGLIRAAGLVNMIPKSRVGNQIRWQRVEAINRCRTLTHWVDKVAPLGDERSEEALKEKMRIDFMKEWQDAVSERRKVLLSFEDLTEEQRQLL